MGMQGGPSVAARNKGGSSPVSAELFHHYLAVHEEREAAAAEEETPTAEQVQQPEARKAQETPAPELQNNFQMASTFSPFPGPILSMWVKGEVDASGNL